jgi:hypothetical protein
MRPNTHQGDAWFVRNSTSLSLMKLMTTTRRPIASAIQLFVVVEVRRSLRGTVPMVAHGFDC